MDYHGEDEQDIEDFLKANEDPFWIKKEECAPYPLFENINFNHPHFQETRGGNLTYYIYGAYYDRRHQIPEIVILAMVSTVTGPYPTTYCQMWFDGESQAEISELHDTKLGWYKEWGNQEELAYPTLLTFRVESRRIPQLVALVFDDRCNVALNAVKVVQPPSSQDEERMRSDGRLRTGICVKYLSFPDEDISLRMVEWMEMMKILGASRVIAYDIGKLHPNTSRTLAKYRNDGYLDLRPYKMLGCRNRKENEILCHRLNEVLLYNDCLYRNMYDFDYMAVIDVDEVPMPLGNLTNWSDLLRVLITRDVECSSRSSYCFRNIYYPRELPEDPKMPKDFLMLSHLTRVAEYCQPAFYAKCLHNTDSVALLHNHFPLAWNDACSPETVPLELGQLQHYRNVRNQKQLKDPPPQRDDNIRRFRHQLIRNSRKVHRQLGW